MSQEPTEQTKLGPGFDAVGVSTAVDQDYPNDWEMEDTASSSVRVVGEVVPEMDVSSLGLSPQVALTADSLRNVTGTGTAAARNLGDADSGSMFDWVSGVNVAETTASGSQTPREEQHPKESFATSRRGRSKSPHGRTGRELSPKSAYHGITSASGTSTSEENDAVLVATSSIATPTCNYCTS